jgi:hypothetical protein
MCLAEQGWPERRADPAPYAQYGTGRSRNSKTKRNWGFGGARWTRTAIVIPTCTRNDGRRVLATDPQYIYCLFDRVQKSGGNSTLLDNLKPYKDHAVIFGRVTELLHPPYPAGLGRAVSDFFNNFLNNYDGDVTFNIRADRDNLDSQPRFWTEGWVNDPNHVRGKLNFWNQNRALRTDHVREVR